MDKRMMLADRDAADDTVEDIAADVASRIVERRMTPRDAFSEAGHFDLWGLTLERHMPDKWEFLPMRRMVEYLKRAIGRAMVKASVSSKAKRIAGRGVMDDRTAARELVRIAESLTAREGDALRGAIWEVSAAIGANVEMIRRLGSRYSASDVSLAASRAAKRLDEATKALGELNRAVDMYEIV